MRLDIDAPLDKAKHPPSVVQKLLQASTVELSVKNIKAAISNAKNESAAKALKAGIRSSIPKNNTGGALRLQQFFILNTMTMSLFRFLAGASNYYPPSKAILILLEVEKRSPFHTLVDFQTILGQLA